VYRLTGKYDRASEEYAAALKVLKDLVARDPPTPKYASYLANTESQIGELIRLRGGTVKEAELITGRPSAWPRSCT